MTAFIDCGVTCVRRASCALDSPLRRSRIDSAVYCGTVRPYGRMRRAISRRRPRSTRAIV